MDDALPAQFPSPFDELGPHPLARAAAEALLRQLEDGWIAPNVSSGPLRTDGAGKMFGVLVVKRPDGTFDSLRAFSGMLEGRWEVEGFVPPAFDRDLRQAIEPAGAAVVKALSARREALELSDELTALRAAEEALRRRHVTELEDMRRQHQENKRARQQRRAELAADSTRTGSAQTLQSLEQLSRGDKAERRRLDERHARELAQVAEPLRKRVRRLRALDRLRAFVSHVLMKRIHDTYRLPNAHGEHRPLRALYPDGEPPSGAGDCAAPKLLAAAYRQGLRPVAMAEFWWGGSPLGGGRSSGAYYPACRGKCGPLLPYMLEGLDCAPSRVHPAPADAPKEQALRIVFEDPWLVVLDKPAGLLSVPGREWTLDAASARASVLARLRRRHPQATGPLLVHRLDEDTSGLLVAALDARTHAALQRQFEQRQIRKRYIAWVDGELSAARGEIALALRVDLDDRPRQIHDPIHGKPAVTRWEVLARRDGRTRLALSPLTGRTHQLRVHCAHPLGLGAPIVGDRLYGRRSERLLLHAELLGLVHPRTGAPLTFESAAPF